nr:OprD family outer membrane porin [Pantoea sp. A4]
MKMKKFNVALTLLAGVISQACLLGQAQAATFSSSAACNADSVDSLTEMFSCGSVHGSLRSLYYSTHNAYFSHGVSQDTISYGGSVKYSTAKYEGFSLGVSGIFQRGIAHNQDHLVSELADNETGVGEAYLSWHYQNFRITAGDQHLNLPFVGDYDWRITPSLFRGVDANYGDAENFLHATKVTRYKPWGDDQFLRTTAYGDERTNGMWALGAGRAVQLDNKKLTGQLWSETYTDYTRIGYADSFLSWTDNAAQPKIGVQFIRGVSDGKALAGEVNSTSYGAQFSMNLSPAVQWSLNYDHIAANSNAYGNGALVTPYAHNISSGPYFAQPFFTSTQDLGSGNAYSTNLNWTTSETLSLGAQYSFMDLTASAGASSSNQSEYLVYGTYSFDGVLKGLSLTDQFGVQTVSTSDSSFWQNRVTLQYNF